MGLDWLRYGCLCLYSGTTYRVTYQQVTIMVWSLTVPTNVIVLRDRSNVLRSVVYSTLHCTLLWCIYVQYLVRQNVLILKCAPYGLILYLTYDDYKCVATYKMVRISSIYQSTSSWHIPWTTWRSILPTIYLNNGTIETRQHVGIMYHATTQAR